MARIVPDDWKSLAATGAAARERETLALLEEALPDWLHRLSRRALDAV